MVLLEVSVVFVRMERSFSAGCSYDMIKLASVSCLESVTPL